MQPKPRRNHLLVSPRRGNFISFLLRAAPDQSATTLIVNGFAPAYADRPVQPRSAGPLHRALVLLLVILGGFSGLTCASVWFGEGFVTNAFK